MGKADRFEMLKGHVELDEAYVGGHRPGKRGRGASRKTVVMDIKERGEKLTTQVIPDVKKETLHAVVLENVERARSRRTNSTATIYSPATATPTARLSTLKRIGHISTTDGRDVPQPH
jgi:hypothetical protein